ncbi:NAD(P)/FAD-dependent oxidoreductase [Mycolicibacterium sp. 050158]|uniref:NAD(P)/FAD-dependent oxidoreductase n=1 Tax=Mycolicibacterium sp. 050158 TaxID=3090602 RepID=UPI00299E4311|nr:NAD(P)-binding protein [Mycolicibacterium sp. 050158]MDX1892107.1 NAD(P)-binding protein [Mycolicibacterium sp. 050158]
MSAVPRVAVVGAGLSGAACARALRDGGVQVEVFDQGRAPGGRMASPTMHGRRVDIGAAYFTVSEPAFASVVEQWAARGLIRDWTDTLDAFSAAGHRLSSGPMRHAAPDGLRSLVQASLPDDVRSGRVVGALDELDHDAVVLAMPDPQAARLAPYAADWVTYEPVVTVIAGWDRRCWPMTHAAFVNDDPDITMVADDGSRRGDGAAVLVTHTTARLAGAHLQTPLDAIAPVLAALARVIDVTADPQWSLAHRWTYAKPVGTHGNKPFALVDGGGRPVGLCGDSWCPSGSPRIESAWLSGHRLGTALAARLES